MVNNLQTERIGGKALKIGRGPVAAAVLAAAAVGTFFGTNLVSEQKTVSVIAETRAFLVGTSTGSVNTGSVASYDTLLLSSPFNADASTRGLQTGTGVSHYLQLDVVANPTGASFDCSKVAAADTGTSGTLYFNNISVTGSVNTYDTKVVLGPTEYVKCGTLDTVITGTTLRLRGLFSDSDVEN